MSFYWTRLGLGFKYISMILKGSEQMLNLLISPYPRTSRHFRVRVGGGMRYLRTEKLRSFHLRPFIVLSITKRAHYKAVRETTCSVNVLKLVSPNQPDLQQLWGRSTSKPNALSLRERTPFDVPHKWGTFAHPDIDRVCLSPSLDHRERL